MKTARSGRRGLLAAAGVIAAGVVCAPSALANDSSDVRHLHLRYGPIEVAPGQNFIKLRPTLENPGEDGYITRLKPDLVRSDGTPTRADTIHLHHGVLMNASRTEATTGLPLDRFIATGQEKSIVEFPEGYGYPSKATDDWLVNDMIHNLTPNPDYVWLTFDIDFVPANTDLGRRMKSVRPIWMDVRNAEAYPVFDVHRGSGSNGLFTYPDDAVDPYPPPPHFNNLLQRQRLNEWTVDRDGTLVMAVGHVHPGGLLTDLEIERPGAVPRSPALIKRARLLERLARRDAHRKGLRKLEGLPASQRSERHRALHRRLAAMRERSERRIADYGPSLIRRVHELEHRAIARAHRRGHRRLASSRGPRRAKLHAALHRRLSAMHRAAHRRLEPRRALLFRSHARYYGPDGPTSWDLSMTRTAPDWRVRVKKGDTLRVSGTYETKLGSWYEQMGIIFAYMADDASGVDPFEHEIDTEGEVTHGHLPENADRSGQPSGLPDPTTFPDGSTLLGNVGIANFAYTPGDFTGNGSLKNPPVVRPGEPVRFENLDAHGQIYHTITSCKAPCNRTPGSGYPIADGPVEFDSGQLGYGTPGFTAASNRTSFETPRNLDPGTYTYFCRVHPFMRGSFRVKK